MPRKPYVFKKPVVVHGDVIVNGDADAPEVNVEGSLHALGTYNVQGNLVLLAPIDRAYPDTFETHFIFMNQTLYEDIFDVTTGKTGLGTNVVGSGEATLTTGAVNGDMEVIWTPYEWEVAKRPDFRVLFSVPDVTNYDFYMAFWEASNDYLLFSATDTGNFKIAIRSGGTSTVDTGIKPVAGTDYLVRIVLQPNGVPLLWINNVSIDITTLTKTMTSANYSARFAVGTNTNAAKVAHVKYVKLIQE